MSNNLHDLSEHLEYIDGGLYWKKIKGSRGPGVGKRYGTPHNGYQQGSYNGKGYKEHRLIWFLHYGYLPKCIDHVDGNGLNNRLENLRDVSQSQNLLNTGKRATNTTGYKNVYFNKVAQKEEARNKYHGGYARHE